MCIRDRPWTDPAVREIVDRVQPAYLTHELAAPDRQAKLRAIRQQLDTIERGGERLEDVYKRQVRNGLISGKSPTILDPKGNATRAEVATILQRMTALMVK